MGDQKFPSWRYGPDGEAEVFTSEADVPKGWEDHPSKVKETKAPVPKSTKALDL
jgi:hypothetical protein